MELLANLEVTLLSALFVALFALRGRLGLASFYLVVGLVFCYMSVGGRLHLSASVLGFAEVHYGLAFVSPLLTCVVLVYILEGTLYARRLVVALALTSAIFYGLKLMLAQHLAGADLALYGRDGWADPPFYPHVVSLIAWLIDGVVIVIIYQGVYNLWRRAPHMLAFTLALFTALVVDTVVYDLLSGKFSLEQVGQYLLGKLVTGFAAAIPAALYVSWQLRRHPELVEGGVLNRSAFEIVNLRRELRSVGKALVRSKAESRHVRQVFGRYVAPDVVEEILSDTNQLKLGGELREVTVVFSDIRGYSTLSEHMSPEQTIDLLNRYFSAMSEIINRYRGTIIEFEGDAILTVFGAPLNQPDHARRAVATAVEMLEEVERLNVRWDADGTSDQWRGIGLANFRIRVGVHSGPVVVGNVGSESRTKYAVIGDTVNIAARVESMNKVLRTTLLLTRQTIDAIGESSWSLRDLGEQEVRGRREPVHVYTVEGLPVLEKGET